MQQPSSVPRREYSKMTTLESAEWDEESVDSFCSSSLSGLYSAVENTGGRVNKSVHVRAYPKNMDVNVEEYFHLMNNSSHSTLIRVRTLYEDDHYYIISFDRVHTSLGNLLANMPNSLVTPPHKHQATDLSPMLVGCLKQIAKSLDYIHSMDRWHGLIMPEEVFLSFGDTHNPVKPEDVRVCLPMRYLESPPFESGRPMTLQQRKERDWKLFGHLIKKLLENAKLNLAELHDLRHRLAEGVIKSAKQLFDHPALWDPLQRSMFLIGVFDILKNATFWSNAFKSKGQWTTRYAAVIALMPNDNPDDQQNPNTFYRFGKLVRNVIAHFDDPDKKSLKSTVGDDRGAALRFFRYEDPELFLDLLSLARNCDHEGLNTLLDTINPS